MKEQSMIFRTSATTSHLALLIFGACLALFTDGATGQDWPPSRDWLQQNKDINDSSVTSIRCPSRDKCLPPGMCKQYDDQQAQEYVKYLCGGASQEAAYGLEMACKVSEIPSAENLKPGEKINCSGIFEDRIRNFEKCIEARNKHMHDCYLDGDQRHLNTVDQLKNGIANCQKLYDKAKSENICR
jgi:hypothetical protein